jgi:hypothetical protein
MNDQVGVDESIRDKAGDYAGEPSDLCSYIVTWNMNSRILLALPEILQGLCRLMCLIGGDVDYVGGVHRCSGSLVVAHMVHQSN